MPVQSQSDFQLIQLAVDQANQDPPNHDAVERLFESHRPRLLRLIGRWIKNRDDAEDVVQITLAKSVSAIGKFNIEEASPDEPASGKPFPSRQSLENRFRAWLDKIAFRCSIDFARKRKNDPSVQVESVETAVALNGATSSSIDHFRESCEVFQIAKEHLNSQQYAVIYLFYVEDLSAKEIAAKLSCSSIAVRALLFRARRALKSKLRKYEVGYE